MTSPEKHWLNGYGATVSGARSKRPTKPTRKALQKSIETKRNQISKSRKRLLNVMQSVEGRNDDNFIEIIARDLTVASEELIQKVVTRINRPVGTSPYTEPSYS